MIKLVICIVLVQVAIISGDGKYVDKVREAQLRINLPNVVCVDAMGLDLKDDHLHLTTEAQVKLGHMLAEVYLKNFVPSWKRFFSCLLC